MGEEMTYAHLGRSGLLVGRIGPKHGLLLGLAVLSLSSVAFAIATGPMALGAARFVQGMSSATTWAAALAWVAVSTPRERRGQALGTVFGVAILGFVVGPMFGGVADLVGIRWSFVGVALVAAGLALALVPKPARAVTQRTDGPSLNGALAGTGAILAGFSLLVTTGLLVAA